MLTDKEELKSRVLMAKANIPHYQLRGKFLELYPEWKGQENQLRSLFNVITTDERFTRQIEEWSRSFNHLNRTK